jgi:hypothetical protein
VQLRADDDQPGAAATASVVLLWFFLFTVWLVVAMPTRCGYKVRDRDRGCRIRVHGIARGCWKYQSQLKRDALFEAFGLRNPGLRFRRIWNTGRRPGHPESILLRILSAAGAYG